MTGDLAVWFRAQLDAEERRLDAPEFVENSNSARSPGWGNRGSECPLCGAYQFDGLESVTEDAWYDHAERVHRRSFTLADITAKRTIIDLHECAPGPIALAGNIDPAGWRESDIPRCDADWSPYPCDTLRLLAQPYAGRPGWHNEWNIT